MKQTPILQKQTPTRIVGVTVKFHFEMENGPVVEDARLIYADLELPKTTVQKIIRSVPHPSTTLASDDKEASWSIQKDAKTAIGRAATLFISYLTAASIDVCNNNSMRFFIDICRCQDDQPRTRLAGPRRTRLALRGHCRGEHRGLGRPSNHSYTL